MPKYLDPSKPCVCSSGKPFGDCCRPYLRDEKEAPDAVSLMRSRYSSFALENAPYLLRTLHHSLPEKSQPEGQMLTALRRACRTYQYPGLQILDSEEKGDDAQVLFFAEMTAKGKDESIVEKSKFVRENGRWFYTTGQTRAAKDFEAPRALRLDTFVPAPEQASAAPK